MADIFVSYTSSDRDWAQWIALELERLGHVAHVHEWEIKGGDDIYAWMEKRHGAGETACPLAGSRFRRKRPAPPRVAAIR